MVLITLKNKPQKNPSPEEEQKRNLRLLALAKCLIEGVVGVGRRGPALVLDRLVDVIITVGTQHEAARLARDLGEVLVGVLVVDVLQVWKRLHDLIPVFVISILGSREVVLEDVLPLLRLIEVRVRPELGEHGDVAHREGVVELG